MRSLSALGRRRKRSREPSVGFIAARGLAAVALIGLVVWLLLRANTGLPLVNYTHLEVQVPDAGTLRGSSPVEVAGVRVGQVLKAEPDGERGALLEIQLLPSTDPLPVDTNAVVRGKGLLGARALQLIPGSAEETLEDGDRIEGGRITAGVPDALLTFDADARRAAGSAIREFGEGIEGRGRGINETIRGAGQVLDEVGSVSREILRREGAAERLFPSLDSGTAAFSAAREDIAKGLGPGAVSLEPFIDSRDAVREMLDVAPGVLASVRSGLGEGGRLLSSARELAVAVNGTLPAAPAALQDTTSLLAAAEGPLVKARPLIRDLRRAAPALVRVTDALDPTLDPLRRNLRDLNPILAQLAPYRCDLDNFAENWRSMLGYGVPGGGEIGPLHAIRFEVIGSPESLAGVGPGTVDLIERFGERVPYPEPCRFSPGGPYGLDRLVGGTG